MSNYVEVAIPDWVNYVTRDFDGKLFGFKHEPRYNTVFNMWEGENLESQFLGVSPNTTPEIFAINHHLSNNKNNNPKTADEILTSMQETLVDRAKARDSEEGERSFEKARDGWWAIFGDNILERGYPLESEICYFMTVLKWVRSLNGEYRYDDHHDAANYCVLGVEAAERENDERPRS